MAAQAVKEIQVDENSPLFDKTGMQHKEFPSDFRQIRYFTLLIVQSAPPDIKDVNLLEQQISEVIKNAVKHGNKCDLEKKVRVWYSFSPEHAHLIVEDEGPGFKDVERWNEFNRPRGQRLRDSRGVRLLPRQQGGRQRRGQRPLRGPRVLGRRLRVQFEAQLRRHAKALPQEAPRRSGRELSAEAHRSGIERSAAKRRSFFMPFGSGRSSGPGRRRPRP